MLPASEQLSFLTARIFCPPWKHRLLAYETFAAEANAMQQFSNHDPIFVPIQAFFGEIKTKSSFA
jgi:hypothetical protein